MLRIRIGQNCNRSMEKFVLHLTILSTLSNWRSFLMANAKTRREKKRKRMHFTTLIWSVIMHEVSTHKRAHVTENPNFTLKCPRFLTGMFAEFEWEANGELKNGQLVELSAFKIVRRRRVDCDEELAVVDNSSWLLGLLTLLSAALLWESRSSRHFLVAVDSMLKTVEPSIVWDIYFYNYIPVESRK